MDLKCSAGKKMFDVVGCEAAVAAGRGACLYTYMNFSGTDESVLLGFARVSERMWVAPSFGSFACSYA